MFKKSVNETDNQAATIEAQLLKSQAAMQHS